MKTHGFESVFKWLALAIVVVTSVSCGSKNLCVERNVRCDSPLVCDPGDGVCKCGGKGGVVCGEGFLCDFVKNTCVSTLCGNVTCAGGTSCDVNDGICKCGGTGGKECQEGQVCSPNTRSCVPAQDCSAVLCPLNQSCDDSSGQCTCGGQSCGSGQTCSIAGANNAKSCVDNLCSGVSCQGDTLCDSTDGYCKCNGVVCQSGEACLCPEGADGGACESSKRSCRASNKCTGVVCTGNTTCDPLDGQCKCGGPGGPACSSDQLCALGPPAQCQGGAQCTLLDGGTKSCAGGTSCDPEDGKCKCGGRGGQECSAASGAEPAEVCVSTALQQACRRPCDPRAPDCAAGTYCYFDPTAATPAAYCTAPAGVRVDGQSCSAASACFVSNPPKSLHCTGLSAGGTGICRAYCDVAAGISGCIQVPVAQTCVQIEGAPAGYGFCQPQ